MLHICVRTFDVTDIVKIFLGTRQGRRILGWMGYGPFAVAEQCIYSAYTTQCNYRLQKARKPSLDTEKFSSPAPSLLTGTAASSSG